MKELELSRASYERAKTKRTNLGQRKISVVCNRTRRATISSVAIALAWVVAAAFRTDTARCADG